MELKKTTTLSTINYIYGDIFIGQMVPISNNRIDKVSIYLEPIISNLELAQSIKVIVSIYNLDMDCLPIGAPIVSDSVFLSDIKMKGYINFNTQTDTPSLIGVVVSVPDGNINNCVGWRYESVSNITNIGALKSLNSGTNWLVDLSKAFAYKAFSAINNAIDQEQQTASILPGKEILITDDITESFEKAKEKNDILITGDTVSINFGSYVITLIVDQSGSMTWNDPNKLRYEFLKDFINNIKSSLPPESDCKFSILKFRGRRLANISIELEGANNSGLHLTGIRVIRKVGSPPTSPVDGVVVYTGSGTFFVDKTLNEFTKYYYATYTYWTHPEAGSIFSAPKIDFVCLSSPLTQIYSVGRFTTSQIITDSEGNALPPEEIDYGYRKVNIEWLNPSGFNYDKITIVRKEGSFPETINDGTVILETSTSTLSFIDTFDNTYSFVNGLTYYYKIFTQNTQDRKVLNINALESSVYINLAKRPWENDEAQIAPLPFQYIPAPPTYSVVASNGEVKINLLTEDLETKRFRIYFNEKYFPTPIDQMGRDYDGKIIFDGSSNSFIHRFQENNQPCFYTIVAYDRLANVSSPVNILIDDKPPVPKESEILIEPLPVSKLDIEALGSKKAIISWEKPEAELPVRSFWFDEQVRITARVNFIDEGSDKFFCTFEFKHSFRASPVSGNINDIKDYIDNDKIVSVSKAPSSDVDSLSCVVSMYPSLSIQRKVLNAHVDIEATLYAVNKTTGLPIFTINSKSISVMFLNPLQMKIETEQKEETEIERLKGEPPQRPVCFFKEILTSTENGVYIKTDKPYRAAIYAEYKGQPIQNPPKVRVEILDTDGNPSKLAFLPQNKNGGETQLSFESKNEEILDRNNQPTGEYIERTYCPLFFPPSTIPGKVLVKAYLNYENWIALAGHSFSYLSTLDIDIQNASMVANGVDSTTLSAYAYFAPLQIRNESKDKEKIPVSDFTITSWVVTPQCIFQPKISIYSKDVIPGDGTFGYTKGGFVNSISVVPTREAFGVYNIGVMVRSEGMERIRYGELSFSESFSKAKIFLKSTESLTESTMYADGISEAEFEILANPEDTEDGRYFKEIVTRKGELVPELKEGQMITIKTRVHGEITTEKTNPMIITNMTPPEGLPIEAIAKIENGKTKIKIRYNTIVPPIKPKLGDADTGIPLNLYYEEIIFEPNSSIFLSVSAYAEVEIQGQLIGCNGGGGNTETSAPPCFVKLMEPLQL